MASTNVSCVLAECVCNSRAVFSLPKGAIRVCCGAGPAAALSSATTICLTSAEDCFTSLACLTSVPSASARSLACVRSAAICNSEVMDASSSKRGQLLPLQTRLEGTLLEKTADVENMASTENNCMATRWDQLVRQMKHGLRNSV